MSNAECTQCVERARLHSGNWFGTGPSNARCEAVRRPRPQRVPRHQPKGQPLTAPRPSTRPDTSPTPPPGHTTPRPAPRETPPQAQDHAAACRALPPPVAHPPSAAAPDRGDGGGGERRNHLFRTPGPRGPRGATSRGFPLCPPEGGPRGRVTGLHPPQTDPRARPTPHLWRCSPCPCSTPRPPGPRRRGGSRAGREERPGRAARPVRPGRAGRRAAHRAARQGPRVRPG